MVNQETGGAGAAPVAAPPRAALNLTDPPRRVPLSLRWQLLFGGFGLFGWVFGGFGMIFVWAFGFNADLPFLYFRGPLATAPGVVLRSEHTNMSEGGSKSSPGTPIYANHYRFEAPAAAATGDVEAAAPREHTGVSYALGEALDSGAAVTVEYVEGKPHRSRIQGMRHKPFGAFATFVFIFPLVGSAIVIARFVSGARSIRLLRDGRLAEGVLESKEPTNMHVNKQQVYRLRFAFLADDGRQYHAVAQSHQMRELEDQVHEPLLYDPLKPGCAVLLDSLPGRPRLDEEGRLVASSSRGHALLSLLLPAIVLVGHGGWAVHRYL